MKVWAKRPRTESRLAEIDNRGIMGPQLGDIVINRYTLVTQLRSAPGIEAWKANDRILARDCQLFIVTDKTALPNLEAIASSLALSRNPRFTPVIQMHHVDQVPVLITQLDGGDTLNNYLSAESKRKLSLEAMRSIVGECALALQALLKDDLTLDCLNTDIVRITPKGIQIADAPVTQLFAQKQRPEPREQGTERMAVRQLSLLLYAMITRQPSSRIQGVDLSALKEQTPEEFVTICGRGLTPSGQIKLKKNGKPVSEAHGLEKMPIASLNELLALLGDWTPVAELGEDDLTRPTIDGQASIATVALRHPKTQNILDFPSTLFQNQLQFRALQQSSHDVEPLDAAPHNAELHGTDQTSIGAAQPTPADPETTAEGSDDTPAENHHHKWWNRYRGAAQKPQDDSRTSVPDLHDLTAAEVAGALKPLDPLAENDLFGDFGQMPSASINQTAHFDFSTATDNESGETENGKHGLEATSRIPLFDDSGKVIEPGQESARALIADEQAQAGTPAALPPSFVPQHETHAASTSRHEDTDDDNIADTPIVGKLTTKTLAIIIVALLIVAAACGAFYALGRSHNTAEYKQTTTNPWPNMNLNEVPFGDQGTDGEADSGDSKSPNNPGNSGTPDNNSGQSGSHIKKRGAHATKNAARVPNPAIPANTTPFTIDKQEFLNNPSGQSGLAYYMHLQQPESAYRFVIHIRSSGGKGHLLAGTSKDPTQGQQLAEFTFDASGTTDIKFKQQSKTQDYMLWVPMDSLPNNQLYIEKVQLY
jgi:putative peptidoglycan lipid II flippase